MIEDKDFKLAESKEEALWIKIKSRTEEAILNAEVEIEINKHVLKLCDKLISIKNTKKKNERGKML